MYGSATSFMPMADHHPRGHALLLQRVLEGQAVHDGGQHAHVVAGGPLHALGRGGQAPEDVAATDDDGHLDTGVLRLVHLVRDELADLRVDAVGARPQERFTGYLQQHPVIARRPCHRRHSCAGVGVSHQSSSPSW